jgi:hypothetical protein
MKHFYVYYSYEEWGRGYIGSRECSCAPKDDVKYFGSFKDKSFFPTQKVILQEFSSRKGALEAEILLHNFFEVTTNPHFANRSKQTSTGFTTSGFHHSEEAKLRIGEESRKRTRTKETRRKTSESNKGQKRSEITKQKLSNERKGKLWWRNFITGEVTLSKGSPGEDWERGRGTLPPRSEDTKRATSNSLKGRPKSENHKQKLSDAAKRRPTKRRVKPS